MKMTKILAAGLLAFSMAACTSAKQDEEVKKDEDLVTKEDSSALKEAADEDKAADENGGSDADYGEPENSDTDTKEVPDSADEVQDPEQEANNDVDQDNAD